MANSRTQVGSHTTGDDHTRRANPLGAYVATLGALILLASMWMNWVGLGARDKEDVFVPGYEADSLIPFMGLLGVGFALALLYALKRADRNQHRGLSLASFAVGLASLLWIILFFFDPIETVKYAGYSGEESPNVATSYGLWIGLIGALLWTLGSFLLAKEPEGDIEHDTARVVSHETRPVTTHTEHTTGHTTGHVTDHTNSHTTGHVTDHGRTGTTGSTGATGSTGTTGTGTGRTGH